MNNRILVSLLLGAMPLTMLAQDDDMYFVPSKQTKERAVANYGMPRSTYYSGSNRSVDEYNRRGQGGSSYYQVVPDTTASGNDIISFSAERGVYPDSTQTEDFALTRQLARYDGYETDLAYRDGYRDGVSDSWHSPLFYSSYYPWYDSYWYWRDPWYYRHYGWYSTWYDPWYYDYGWYGPYHYGYYSYYRPYYYGGGYYSGRSRLYSRNGNTGTIDRSGRSHGYFTGGSRATSSTSSRATQRATSNNSTVYRSNSGNFSRSTSNSGNFSRSTSNSGSFSSGSSSAGRSSGGSFSGGGGGSRGGGSIGRAGRR